MRSRITAVAAGLIALCGCAGGDEAQVAPTAATGPAPNSTRPASSSTVPALPLAEHPAARPVDTSPSDDLAPSQVAASTVAEPPTPEPCSVDTLEFWTAQVRPSAPDATTVDAVVRIRNVSSAWCEVDISRSPAIDPAVEPDVWLDPGATADLVVGQRPAAGEECAEPSPLRLMELAVGVQPVVVPTAALTCGWWLTALYPNDVAVDRCGVDDVHVAIVGSAVLLRSRSPQPCALGATPGIDGRSSATPPDTTPSAVVEMQFGDVVAIGADSRATCAGAPTTAVMTDLLAAPLTIDGVPCDTALGPAQAWLGGADDPLAVVAAGDFDAEAARRALDPFAT